MEPRAQPRKASGDVPPATARAGTSQRNVPTTSEGRRKKEECRTERRPLRTPRPVKGKMFAYVRLCSLNWKKMFQSLFGNYEGRCFRGKGRMARRDEGEYPWWIFD